jgi:hypothetical protein
MKYRTLADKVFAELSHFLDTNIFGGALTLNSETQSHRKIGAPFINAVA